MPIDLSAFGESLQRGLGEIPPVAVALALLAGPTLLFTDAVSPVMPEASSK